MSVDARIRRGLTMIDKDLPVVDTIGAYEDLERGIRRDSRRRRVLIAAVAAIALVLSAATALLSRPGGGDVEPAPPLPTRVYYLDDDGGVSYVAGDGSRQSLPATNVDRFALSPDGHQLAYIGGGPEGQRRGLWIVDADGSNGHRITLCARCIPGWGLAWSHDGTRLAFVTSRPGEPTWQVRVRTLATGEELELEERDVLSGVAFSPDDEHLALVVGSENPVVSTIDVGDRLASLRPVSPSHRAVQAPVWSQDGTTIYYTASDTEPDPTRSDTDTPLDLLRVSDVYALDVTAGQERQVTHAVVGERYYVVQPHGDRFLTTHADSSGDPIIGWLSQDGSSFEPILEPTGRPLTGLSAELQP
jgi:Tol biopolymer transport system component